MITEQQLLQMNNQQLFEVMQQGHAVPSSVAGKMYLGIDLSLPPIVNKILWKTFRKTFYRDPASGNIRGWNVRMQQTGYNVPGKPITDKTGRPVAFGHYELLDATGKTFPRNWKGDTFLDYGNIGNAWYDMARLGYCPLVAVNKGSDELLLGWEVFKIGSLFVPLNDFWLLKYEAPLDVVEPAPGNK